MWNKKPAGVKTFAACLCAGLLLMGIGAGVQLAEFSALSYGGENLVEDTRREEHMVVSLSPSAQLIRLKGGDGRFSKQLREGYQIQTDESVDPGTVAVDFYYEGGPVGFAYDSDTDQVPMLQTIDLYWFHEQEVSTFMNWRDALLEDLRQGQLCDYKLWQLNQVTIRVNPADADRITVF